MKTLGKNKFIALVFTLCLLIAAGSVGFTVYAATNPSWTTTFETGSLVDTASYVVFRDGSTYFAKNGTTGAIDYSGTNKTEIIENANDALTSGGVIYLKDIQFDTAITLGTNVTIVEQYGGWTNNFIHTGKTTVTGIVDGIASEFSIMSGLTDTEAHQGVAYDGKFFYTVIGGDSVEWNRILKFNSTGDVLMNVTVNNDSYGTELKQLNSITFKNGILYIGANNFNNVTRYGWVIEYYASDLSYITHHATENYWSEGGAWYDDYFWVVYGGVVGHYPDIISQYDKDWNLVATHPTPYSDTTYQGGSWLGDYYYVNNHGSAPSETTDILYWNGTGFEGEARLAAIGSGQKCTQGLQFDKDYPHIIYLAERNNPQGTDNIILAYVNGTILTPSNVTVTHNLPSTPTTVIVTPISIGFSAGDFYVRDVTATTFDIVCTKSGTFDVYWYAEYKP